MDPKKRDRKKWEEDMHQHQITARRTEAAITAAIIVMAAIALGVSLYGLIGHLLFPLIEALGGAQ